MLLLAGGWQWLAYLRSPQTVARQFLAAIERQDYQAAYDLVMVREKRDMGVTPDAIARVTYELLYRKAPRVVAMHNAGTENDGLRARNWYRHHLVWGDGATGNRLPGSGEVIDANLDLFRSEQGRWEVSFTRFADSYLRFTVSAPMLRRLQGNEIERHLQTRRHRRLLLQRLGITSVVHAPAIRKVDGEAVALLETPAHDPLRRFERQGRP